MKAAHLVIGLQTLVIAWIVWRWMETRRELDRLQTSIRAELPRTTAGDVAATLPSTSAAPALSSANTTADNNSPRNPAPSAAPARTRLTVSTKNDGRLAINDGKNELATLSPDDALALQTALRKSASDIKNKGPGGASYSAGAATGPPDAAASGSDSASAWCPAPSSSAGEWLQLKYERPVEISELAIHETYATGALARVVALMPDGTEKTIWEGNEPVESPPVERIVPVPRGIHSDRIRLVLDTTRTGTWQEIDAVELIGRDGSRQWAKEATASSHYGSESTGWNYGAVDVFSTRRL